jgi:NAD(P)-dependent dehydrogenase (short-subunit alcohol dehydrogenase family)
MVNNAGVHVSREFLDVSPAEFERVHAVDARGVFFGTQAAARDMLDRGEPGSIVNTASTTAEQAAREHAHYGATKGAVRMITRGAALELAAAGVRVNAVAPGPIATEITEGWTERADEVSGPDPPVRAGDPEEVAGAFCFLASDDASYVTGETVFVDGGDTIA